MRVVVWEVSQSRSRDFIVLRWAVAVENGHPVSQSRSRDFIVLSLAEKSLMTLACHNPVRGILLF